MIKTLAFSFIAILAMGYALIYVDSNKFEQLCRDEPTIPQCPEPEKGKAL